VILAAALAADITEHPFGWVHVCVALHALELTLQDLDKVNSDCLVGCVCHNVIKHKRANAQMFF
jgi:hypothetical protein